MTLSVDVTIEAAIRRDRAIVIATLIAIIALSWVYLLAGAGMGMSGLEMTRMSQHELAGHMTHAYMMQPAIWTTAYTVLMFFMWWIMMAAMMLPSAAPLILVFATINRRQRDSRNPHVATGIFTLGYLVAWGGYSMAGVSLQWLFERIGIISPMLVANSAILGGILLLAAGVYQLTPLKHACLRRCRSPLDFLAARWRRGAAGALYMGLLHGAFCVGCCWFLMALMFIGGLMNLYWVAGLALYFLIEKTVPAGHWFAYATGIVLLLWGAGMLVNAF